MRFTALPTAVSSNLLQPKLLTKNRLVIGWRGDRSFFFGDGAAKCRAVLGGHPNAVFVDQLIVPSARTVGTLATPAFVEGRFEDVATFEPFYLKEFMTAKPKQAML